MKFKFKGEEYYIDQTLATQLDSIIYNWRKDFDFIILISGDRTVRVGKSVLGMTVCTYLAAKGQERGIKTDYGLENIFFDNKKLLEAAQKSPPNSIFHYDEGREGLAASKTMYGFQEDLLDFFAECGQLNHVFVVVLPDFFELKEQIAVARSEFLLNVYRIEKKILVKNMYKDGVDRPVVRLDRGYFEFFNRKRKQILFDKARSTRRKSYKLVSNNFSGRFTDQYPVGEEEYKGMKSEALKRFVEKKDDEKMTKSRADIIRDRMILRAHIDGLKHQEIADKLMKDWGYSLSSAWVSKIILSHSRLKTNLYKDMMKETEKRQNSGATRSG